MATTITRNMPIIGRRAWTAQEYDRLAELGFFDGEKLELIEGEIIPKMTQNVPHASGVWLVQTVLLRIFTTGFMVRVQAPLALGTGSRPEPDIAVVRGTLSDYPNTHPTTAVLVVEVSDSTLRQDRETKASLYAEHRIPEYWIVNLVENTVEIHSDPIPMNETVFGHGYRSVSKLRVGQSFSPLAAPNVTIAVGELLP